MDVLIGVGIVALILGVAMVYANNTNNKQIHAGYAAAMANITSVATKAIDTVKSAQAPVAAPAGTSVNHSVTFTTPGVAGAVTAAPAPATHNNVVVPAGMSQSQFVALVMAKLGVSRNVGPKADPNVVANLVASLDPYFANLGQYFVEQYLLQAPAGTPVGDRVRKFVADTKFAVETVTDAQELAAVQAAAGDGGSAAASA
jgi:hypothetical protein